MNKKNPVFDSLVPDSDRKSLPKFGSVYESLMPAIANELLRPLGEVSYKSFGTFLNCIKYTAKYAVDQHNLLALERAVPRTMRPLLARLGRARKQVASASNILGVLEKLIREDVATFRLDYIQPSKAHAALQELDTRIEAVQVFITELIHPRLRSNRDLEILAKKKQQLKHTTLPVNPGSAKLQYQVTEMLESYLTKCFGKQLPSASIDRFIAEFFAVTMGLRGMTADNVKTMRLRLKREKIATARQARSARQNSRL